MRAKEAKPKAPADQIVGLEYRAAGRRDSHRAWAAKRPHWTNLILRRGTVLHKVLPNEQYSLQDLDDLSRLYESFRASANLGVFRFYRNEIAKGELTIKRAIEEYVNQLYPGKAVYNIWEENDTDFPCFTVAYEIEQPPSDYKALYIEDIYEWKDHDKAVYDLLIRGLEILVHGIGYNEWSYHSPEDRVQDNLSELIDDLRNIEKIKARTPDEEEQRSKLISDIAEIERELQEYDQLKKDFAMWPKQIITARQFKGLLNKISKKKYPDIHTWAYSIWSLYSKNIELGDYIPRDPDTLFMTAKDYHYVALRPGYIADGYEENVDAYAQEGSWELMKLDHYSPHKVYCPEWIDWNKYTEIFFSIDFRSGRFIGESLLIDKLR